MRVLYTLDTATGDLYDLCVRHSLDGGHYANHVVEVLRGLPQDERTPRDLDLYVTDEDHLAALANGDAPGGCYATIRYRYPGDWIVLPPEGDERRGR